MSPGKGNLTAMEIFKLVGIGKINVRICNSSSFKFIEWASEAKVLTVHHESVIFLKKNKQVLHFGKVHMPNI